MRIRPGARRQLNARAAGPRTPAATPRPWLAAHEVAHAPRSASWIAFAFQALVSVVVGAAVAHALEIRPSGTVLSPHVVTGVFATSAYIGGVLAAVACTWHLAPRGLGPLDACFRALRVAVATGWIPIVGVAAIGITYALLDDVLLSRPKLQMVLGSLTTVAGLPAVALLWIGAVWRATLANMPPRRGHERLCERCGYNLAARTLDERCPECNTPVRESLAPNARRGSAWERRPGWRTFFADSGLCLLRPGAFYARLHALARFGSARRFAVLHYRWLGFVAVLWFVAFFVAVQAGPPSTSAELQEFVAAASLIWGLAFSVGLGTPLLHAGRFRDAWLTLPLTVSLLMVLVSFRTSFTRDTTLALSLSPAVCLWAPLLCLAWIRGLGLLPAAIARWRDPAIDMRRVEKVLAYETVFCWVLCTGLAALITSFGIWGTWVTKLTGELFWFATFGGSGEPAVVLGWLLAATLIALWRVQCAFRALQWANR